MRPRGATAAYRHIIFSVFHPPRCTGAYVQSTIQVESRYGERERQPRVVRNWVAWVELPDERQHPRIYGRRRRVAPGLPHGAIAQVDRHDINGRQDHLRTGDLE